jgi:hypothetical protein
MHGPPGPDYSDHAAGLDVRSAQQLAERRLAGQTQRAMRALAVLEARNVLLADEHELLLAAQVGS